MSPIYKVLKALVLPPLDVVVLAVVGWLLGRRWPRVGRTLVVVAGLALYLLMTPYVSSTLLQTLQSYPAFTPEHADKDAGAIVVLSSDSYREAPEYRGDTVGGSTLERLRYGAWLFRELDVPLLVTGGTLSGVGTAPTAALMQESLIRDFQVPVRWVESEARTTYENAKFSAQILQSMDIHKIYLVTHAWHMPRAMASFQAFGIESIPAPTSFARKPRPFLTDFVPTAGSLLVSYQALHEWIGRLWYTLYYY